VVFIRVAMEIYTKSAFTQDDNYMLAYWKLRVLYLNVRERVTFDSQYPYYVNIFQINILFTHLLRQ